MGTIQELVGGMSNKIYLLNDNVILRLFGVNSDVLVNCDNEKYILQTLGAKNLSPKIILDFDGGRLEEYIKNSRILTTFDILHNKTILINLIGKIKELHNINLNHTKPALIENINNWTNSAIKLDPSYNEIYDLKDYILNQLNNINTLGIVLCHNDLNKSNILVEKDISTIKLIDFEYCGYNFIEFEIANFLCELLFEYNEVGFEFIDFDLTDISKLVCELYTDNYDDSVILFNNLKIFFVATNYLWIIWSIIKSNNNGSLHYKIFIENRTNLLKKWLV